MPLGVPCQHNHFSSSHGSNRQCIRWLTVRSMYIFYFYLVEQLGIIHPAAADNSNFDFILNHSSSDNSFYIYAFSCCLPKKGNQSIKLFRRPCLLISQLTLRRPGQSRRLPTHHQPRVPFRSVLSYLYVWRVYPTHIPSDNSLR